MTPSKLRRRPSWMCARRAALAVLAALVLYVLLSPRPYLYVDEYAIEQAKPEDVWNFVADFSNMPKLNPTILDWELLSDWSTGGHWKYSVRYTEKLSGLSGVTNYATAHFEVIPAQLNSDFIIKSIHSTCFYSDYFCLPSYSESRFASRDSGLTTLYSERIVFSCPWLFASFCQREVDYQRHKIRENLKLELYSQTK